jgi:hypothetical protein
MTGQTRIPLEQILGQPQPSQHVGDPPPQVPVPSSEPKIRAGRRTPRRKAAHVQPDASLRSKDIKRVRVSVSRSSLLSPGKEDVAPKATPEAETRTATSDVYASGIQDLLEQDEELW